MEISIEKQVLPSFRKDLQLYQGPDEADGSPSFNVYDPVKGQYYKISWGESLIIKLHRPGLTVEQLCEIINHRSTLKVTPAEIYGYFQDAGRHNLLAYPVSSEKLQEETENRKSNPLMWLLMHYLYVRVPMWDPDVFLKRTLPYARLFASPFAFLLYGFLTVVGVSMAVTRLDDFMYTLPQFFNLQGVILYAIVLSVVKVVHELAHAYTAVHFNVRVPSMGVAFLVMWPVLYTDVTDGWKLLRRKDRFYISLAGIVAETVIAGLCTFGWAMSSQGMLKSLFFVIASISWFSTLILNSNPAMRFDGYYILSDLWGIDNLQNRAFAVTRWKLREWIFGIFTTPPEQQLSLKRIQGMIIYSLFTWCYRIILYTGIAFFIYATFTKALGIILFALEIGIFLLWPIIGELQTVYKLRDKMHLRVRGLITSALLLVGILWLITPLQRHERFTAITVPENEQSLYVPYDAIITKIFVNIGQELQSGAPIIKLESQPLEAEIKKISLDEELEKLRIKILSQGEGSQYIKRQMEELQVLQAKKESLLARKKDLFIKARRDGVLYEWNENLKVGQFVSKDQLIGKISDSTQAEVIAFVPEYLMQYVHEGKDVEFITTTEFNKYQGHIVRLNPVRTGKLLYPSLASIYRGNLMVSKDSSGNLQLLDSYFPVVVKLEADEKIRYGQTGTLHLEGPKRSLLVSGMKRVLSLFWRESGGF